MNNFGDSLKAGINARTTLALPIVAVATCAWFGWFAASSALNFAEIDTARMLSSVLRIPAEQRWLGSVILALILVGLGVFYLEVARRRPSSADIRTGLSFGVVLWLAVGCVLIPLFGLAWPSTESSMGRGGDAMQPSFMMLGLGWRGPVSAFVGWALFGALLGLLCPLYRSPFPQRQLRSLDGQRRSALALALAIAVVAAALVSDPVDRDRTGSSMSEAASQSMSEATRHSVSGDGGIVAGNAMHGDETIGAMHAARRDMMPSVPGIAGMRPQSMSIPSGNRDTWVGVTDDEIKIAFAIDQTGCGLDPLEYVRRTTGALPAQSRFFRSYPTTQEQVVNDNREAIEHITRYWNDNASKASMADMQSKMVERSGRAFYGRKITPVVVDGGSAQCPERTRDASRELVETVKPFAVVNQDIDMQAAFNMATGLAGARRDRRPMHFGSAWLPARNYEAWAPYTWTFWPSGTTNVRQFASYVCSRLVGKKATGSSDAELKASARKFGLVHPRWEQSRTLAAEFKSAIARSCGRSVIAVEEEYTLDISRAADDSRRIVRTMQGEGVTSLLMLTDLLYPVFQMKAASLEDYHPEWVWSGHNYTDTSIVQRAYTSVNPDEVDRASFGISNMGVPGGFAFDAIAPFWLYHAYHTMSDDGHRCDPSSMEGMDHPGCKAPASIVLWFTSLLPLVMGMKLAGPDLTPASLTRGLQSLPPTRIGAAIKGYADMLSGAGAGKRVARRCRRVPVAGEVQGAAAGRGERVGRVHRLSASLLLVACSTVSGVGAQRGKIRRLVRRCAVRALRLSRERRLSALAVTDITSSSKGEA